MTPQMLNTIPQAANLGPQNNRDGIASAFLFFKEQTKRKKSNTGPVLCKDFNEDGR